jgi:hypothetical protein
MRVDLKLPRERWAFFGALFLILGIPFVVAVPLLLVVATADQNPGALVGVVFGPMIGGVWVPAGIVAWRISRSRPSIVVTGDTITIWHPGVLVRPVELSRADVHALYVRPFEGRHRPPRFEGNGWQRLRQRSRWADGRVGVPNPLPISSWHCPDLSVLHSFEDHNLLIVFANPMPMTDTARRGLGALSLAVARGMSFTGPTKATVARGFFALAVDGEQARRAFASWPKAETPYPELWDWLYAGSQRGFGWLGWRRPRRA